MNPNLITEAKYKELIKVHVMFKDMVAGPYLKSAGISSDWPCGRGCNLDTGMRALVHLKIPNLTRDDTDSKAVAAAKPLGLSLRRTGGEHTPIGADGTWTYLPRAAFL